MYVRKKQNACRLQESTVRITAKQVILYHTNAPLNGQKRLMEMY